MRTKSNPLVIGIVYAAYVFIIATAIVMHGGCGGLPPVPTSTRAPIEAAATAVRIETECTRGSGVLFDSTRVLTAHHVIDCDLSDKKVRLAKTVRVHFADGRVFVATYDALDATRDLARLRLPSAIGIPTLTVARATTGQLVCAVTAVPDRRITCGDIGAVKAPRFWGDLHVRGAQLWLGNSGSGLYNTEGALVGIVTRMYFCNEIDEALWSNLEIKPPRTCGGRASSLEGPVKP